MIRGSGFGMRPFVTHLRQAVKHSSRGWRGSSPGGGNRVLLPWKATGPEPLTRPVPTPKHDSTTDIDLPEAAQ